MVNVSIANDIDEVRFFNSKGVKIPTGNRMAMAKIPMTNAISTENISSNIDFFLSLYNISFDKV